MGMARFFRNKNQFGDFFWLCLQNLQLLCVLTIEDNDTFPVNETFFFPKEK